MTAIRKNLNKNKKGCKIMKTKKLLSMLTLVCMLVGLLVVPAATVSAAGLEIPANATLVHSVDYSGSTR